MLTRKLLALLLTLCLLAGCGTAGSPAPEVPASPAEPPPPEASLPQEPSRPDGILPQEDPDHPGWLAGAELYYTPGNRLTLYAMAPETGALRTVRQNDFWNGREVESVSPSGRWLLLSSWDGAPSRSVVALSLYDIQRDLLVNLSREEAGQAGGSWQESHWFPGRTSYCFAGDSTFYYRQLCYCQEDGQPHLHRYTVGEDGRVTARRQELECPPRAQSWASSCVLLPEEGRIFCNLEMEEGSFEWLTWEMESGRLLDRRPGNNGGVGEVYRDGVFYSIYHDRENAPGTFQLVAYQKDTDTAEVLASGAIPCAPGMEQEPIDSRGVLETVWVEEVREDGVVVLGSAGEEIRYGAATSWREALWSPAAGKEIRFGERQSAPTFPVDAARGYGITFVAPPDGVGLYLPVPQDMVEYYRDNGGQPYPIATLPTGELLFLAAGPQAVLPQEDPERPGQLAGAAQQDGGSHRLTLYALRPGTGELRVVRGESFWNGLAVEDTSPSGNRVLLATRDSTKDNTAVALSVYDIAENRLYNLAGSSQSEGVPRQGRHWLPGGCRYRFADEQSILYQELTGNGYGSVNAPRCLWMENGRIDRYNLWVEAPELPERFNSAGCAYLPEEGVLVGCLPVGEEGRVEWFRWAVAPWEEWKWSMDTAPILSRWAEENPRDAALLADAADLSPRPAALPDGFRPPEELKNPRPVAVLQNGEILFLAG